MAYDSESDKIILFGGALPGGPPYKVNDETWAYDVSSKTWIEMKPTSGPSLREAVDLVYDSKSDRIILFGGVTGGTLQTASVLNDTWAYDYNTNTWTELAKGPGDHLGYRMAYDSKSDRCILFGGLGFPSFKMYNDTWAYDFNSDTWTEMQPSTSPPARDYHAMAYDAHTDRVILFGGFELDENMQFIALSDTWAYDYNTNTWQELERGQGEYPSGRGYHTLVYNKKAGRSILFGGSSGGTETWSYDYSTNTWTQLKPSQNPGMRTRHAMAYCSAADLFIMFGGQPGEVILDYTNQIWAFDLNKNTWTNLTRRP
jgi:N-acetylneuraminic acid mutarotase